MAGGEASMQKPGHRNLHVRVQHCW